MRVCVLTVQGPGEPPGMCRTHKACLMAWTGCGPSAAPKHPRNSEAKVCMALPAPLWTLKRHSCPLAHTLLCPSLGATLLSH